jgi:DNA-binding NarL/FixJ family response regulator
VPGSVNLLLAEGRQALEMARWADARDAFAAALETDAAPEALLGLSDALWWLGDLDESVACKERAFALFRDRGDASQAALAAILLCLDYRKQYGNAVASAGWLAQADRLVEHHDLTELRGWLLFAKSFECEQPVTAEELARQAHVLALRMGDRDLELCALSQTGAALVEQGRVEEGIKCLDESMAVSLGTGGTPETVVFTSCMMMTSCTNCADFARAAQWVQATITFTEQYGCPFLYAECRILYGALLLGTGDWQRAEEELLAGLNMARGTVPALHRLAVANLARLRLAQGQLEEAERLVAGHEEHAEIAPVLARIHLQRGGPKPAVAVLRRRLAAVGEASLESGELLELLGDARLATGDTDVAAEHGRTLIDLGASAGCELLRARGERLLGRAADVRGAPDTARLHLDIALVTFARLGMPWEVARTRAALAEALREVETDVAVAEAKAALAAFEGLGASTDADAVASLLRSTGVSASRLGPRRGVGLTKREDQVLELLGEGLSNPEIASRLHLSRKTVEHHVAHVLAKLGVSSRAQAVVEAARRPAKSSAAK